MPPIIAAILAYIWSLVKTWGNLWAAPFQNLEMLWVIIPAYLNWWFADFFQEKKGTSLGNATSNAVIVLWAAIDWTRTSLRFFKEQIISGWNLTANIGASVLVFFYGAWVVYEGIKGNKLTHYIGRIRVVTYIVLMITPLVYGVELEITKSIIAMIAFFPVFYYLNELIEYLLPDPESIKQDGAGFSDKDNFGGSNDFGSSDSSSDLGSDDDFSDMKI
jgi:hypothetical protein